MDRESAGRESDDVTLVEAARANAPSGPTLVSVCITCRTADGATVVGPDMFELIKAAIGLSDHVQVRPVQCLSVCKRPATVAVTSADGYTFLFGDLQTESGTPLWCRSSNPTRNPVTAWCHGASVLRCCARAWWRGCRRCAGRRTTEARRNDGACHHAGAGRRALRQICLCRAVDRRQRACAGLPRHRDCRRRRDAGSHHPSS